MEPNLPILRVRIGLPDDDASKDIDITLAWNTALALAEQYLDRYLTHDDRTENFTHILSDTIQLRAYPEVTIIKISGANLAYHLNKERGLLYFDGTLGAHELSIEYSGGYTVLPDDLILAITVLFDSVWSIMSNPGGGSASAGALKSVKAGDISIQWDTGGSASVSSEGGLGGTIPPVAQGILETYRRWAA